MKKSVILLILSVFLFSANAMAAPNYSAIESILNGIAVDGNIDLNVATDAIDDRLDSYWEVTGAGISAATFIIELAGFAGTNTLGIYDASNPSNKVTLFDGTDGAGAQTVISIKSDGSVYKNFKDTGVNFANNLFGYYLDATAGMGDNLSIFFSDTSLNADGIDHMLAYRGTNSEYVALPGCMPGLWTSDEYVLAFEDLLGGGDLDYDDLVIMVESVKTKPVPEPGTMFLLGSGILGLAGIRRKRMKK